MSWSISAGGRPEHVREIVRGAYVPESQEQGEIAREMIKELLATMPEASNVSVSASGHHGDRQGNVQITVAYSPVDPAPPAAGGQP